MFKGDSDGPRREYRGIRNKSSRERIEPALIDTEFAGALERAGVSLDELFRHTTVEKRNISQVVILLPPLILHFRWYDPSQERYFEFGFSFEEFSDTSFNIVGRQLFAEGWGGMRGLSLNNELFGEAQITFVAWSHNTAAYHDFLEKRGGAAPAGA